VETTEQFRYLILAAQREGSRRLAQMLAPLGLTPSQAEVLTVLDRAGEPLSLREVGDLLICERSSPSRLVRTMERDGLLRLQPHPGDGRINLASLTSTGRRLATRVASIEAQLHDWLREAVPDDELNAALDALQAVVAGTDSADALDRRRSIA